jgi:hypothetical protein
VAAWDRADEAEASGANRAIPPATVVTAATPTRTDLVTDRDLLMG